MKKWRTALFAILAMALFSVACTEKNLEPEKPAEPEVKPEVPEEVVPELAVIQGVDGIEETYTLGLHEFLQIRPVIKTDDGDPSKIVCEWTFNNEKVSDLDSLKLKCSTLGEFTGSFKVQSGDQKAVIRDFKVSVTNPYGRGLLLLSDTKDGAMLSYKRLDIMETAACPMAFKDNNPDKELGRQALDLAWFGAAITSYGSQMDREHHLDLLLSTDEPNKVYELDPNTLQVKQEISCPIPAQKIFINYGFQQEVWDGHRAYFIGDEMEKVLGTNNLVIKSDLMPSYQLANFATSLLTEEGDMLRIYYDHQQKRICFHSRVLSGTMESDNKLAEPIFMDVAAGSYLSDEGNRYAPTRLILVTNDGGKTKAFRILPIDYLYMSEEIEAEVETTGKILPESAIAVHPVKPVLYFSNLNTVSRLDMDKKSFDETPYIQLPARFLIKKVVMNPYDPTQLYIAAEDQEEKGEMKASLFVYDIQDAATSVLLFEGHQVGGNVRQLIYKGDGQENTRI